MSIEWTEPTRTSAAPALWELPATNPRTPEPVAAFAPPALDEAPTQVHRPLQAAEVPTQLHRPVPDAELPTQIHRPVPAAQAPHHGVVPPAGMAAPQPMASAEHPLAVASLGRRAVGHLLDAIILGVVGGLLVWGIDALLGLSTTSERADGSPAAVLAGLAYVVLVACVQFTYRTVPALEGMRGQSLGQRALGVRFVRVDGTRASAGLAMRRAAAAVGPSALLTAIVGLVTSTVASTPLLVVGLLIVVAYPVVDLLIMPLAGLGRQTLHDRMAGTVVVDAGSMAPAPGEQPATIVGRPRTAATWSFSIGSTLIVVVSLLLLLLLASIGAAAEASMLDSYDTLESAPYSYASPASFEGAAADPCR